jgi:hypothetical protein
LHFVVMCLRECSALEIGDAVDAKDHRLAVDHEPPVPKQQRTHFQSQASDGSVSVGGKPGAHGMRNSLTVLAFFVVMVFKVKIKSFTLTSTLPNLDDGDDRKRGNVAFFHPKDSVTRSAGATHQQGWHRATRLVEGQPAPGVRHPLHRTLPTVASFRSEPAQVQD